MNTHLLILWSILWAIGHALVGTILTTIFWKVKGNLSVKHHNTSLEMMMVFSVLLGLHIGMAGIAFFGGAILGSLVQHLIFSSPLFPVPDDLAESILSDVG